MQSREAGTDWPLPSSLNGLTSKPERTEKNRTTFCLPFVMLKCPVFQPQRRSAIICLNDLNGLVELEG